MKKNYIYPTVESVKVNAQMSLCGVASPGLNITGDVISGGDDGDNPGGGL